MGGGVCPLVSHRGRIASSREGREGTPRAFCGACKVPKINDGGEVMDVWEVLNVLSGLVVGIVTYVWISNVANAVEYAKKAGFKY